ncbi:MltA domain-containing protein [Bilophila wadsworthia]|uniref:MltA domain-containing protein n=1 Tax=Bilophila wadsworthia TaxID=35833 RepID=UPI0024312B6F|nr:MltA domain-containing protein [Bilophila wadsworthia]
MAERRPEVKFTGYYSPVMQASRTRKPGYEYPIYRLPEELAPDLAWCLPTHSCPEDAFLQVIKPEDPYYSRADIDLDGALKSRNLEMAWLEHPVETYDLMLEGSGILAFDDGTQQAALFAGLNGHSGQSMAGYLIRSGELPRNKASMKGIRQWWDNHPQKRRAFLNASSGYVFFRFGAEHPKGTAGCELTPWVSMAVDPRVLPLGGIVSYALPGQRQGIRRGLGFAHDTGGAIRLRRIDIYTGEGEDAHRQAMTIYNQGQVWLLLAKQ